jgi:hypothetical protein
MSYNIALALKAFLRAHPECRSSYNRLVVGYWIHQEGWGRTQREFDRLTPLETLCREARKIFAEHPELSPTSAPPEPDYHTSLWSVVSEVFPGSARSDPA